MVSRRMSVRTADCETAVCEKQAPDISYGQLDSLLEHLAIFLKIDPCSSSSNTGSNISFRTNFPGWASS